MLARRILPVALMSVAVAAIAPTAGAATRVRPYTPLYAELQNLSRARNLPLEQVLADPQRWLDEMSHRPPHAPAVVSSTTTPSTVTAPSAESLPIQFAGARTLGEGFSRLAAGDFDGDGVADIAAAGDAGAVAIFPGSAAHPLQSRRDVPLEGGDALETATDVDGDGRCDLIAVRSADTTVAVYRSLGSGGFAAPARYAIGAMGLGPGGGRVSAGDLTGDGRPDLVILKDGGAAVVTLLNTGNGGFVAGVTTAVGACSGVHAVADFDGDGRQDVALRTLTTYQPDASDAIRVLLSRGDGSFDAASEIAVEPYSGFAGLGAGDIDGDGHADLIVCDDLDVRLLLGHGDGSFGEGPVLPIEGTGSSESFVQVADFNGDGRLDIAIRAKTGECFCGSCPQVVVLFGSETALLSQPHYYLVDDPDVSRWAIGLVSADLDADGAPDLADISQAYGYAPEQRLHAIMNAGDGGLLAPLSLDLGFGPWGVAAARLQASGPPDVLVWDGSSTLIARNRGRQGFARIASFLDGEVVSTADLDGDGTDDLILASGDSATVYLNDGAGGLRAPVTYAGGHYLTRADFDGTNGPDLAVADGSRRVLIRHNDGHGAFGPPEDSGVALESDVTSVQGGDLDLDGRADLLVGRRNWEGPDTLGVYWNLDGSFAPAESHVIATEPFDRYSGPSTIALGDFDGNGRPDVVVVDAASGDEQGGISVLRGAGGRALLPAVEYATRPDPWEAVVSDFDRDGLDDIAVVCDHDNYDGTLCLFQGTPGGPIAQGEITTRHYPTSIALGDFDLDGDADLLVGNVASKAAMIFRNVSSAGIPTPALASLLSAQAAPGLVRLTWYVAPPGAFAAAVERSAGDGPWTALGRARADGSGHLAWEDRDVTPGARYGYRLRFSAGGQEVLAGETWVEVPKTAAFALQGARPNPARGGVAIAFSLPDASPAHLEVLDLAGRRIVIREVGALGPGGHVVSLAEERAIPVGVYYARLTSRGASATARFVRIE